MIALVFSIGLNGYPGSKPRMTGRGVEKMNASPVSVDISKDRLDAHRLSDGAARAFPDTLLNTTHC